MASDLASHAPACDDDREDIREFREARLQGQHQRSALSDESQYLLQEILQPLLPSPCRLDDLPQTKLRPPSQHIPGFIGCCE
jgi:hypothetical protein